MPFPKTPAFEDQIVLRNLGQRGFKSTAGHRRKNDIIKSSARHHGFDRSTARNAKETRECGRPHPLTPSPCPVGINAVGTSSPDLARTTVCTRFRQCFPTASRTDQP